MKAMLLAAGKGTRLKDKTTEIPKALVEVNGKPIIDYVISKLVAGGVDEIIVNLHYKGELLRKHLKGNNSWGIKIEFSEEEELLDTGGGILKARWFFDREPFFLVHNCDVYSELDLAGLVEKHNEAGGIATLAVTRRDTARALLFNSSGELIGRPNRDGSIEYLPEESHTDSLRYGFNGIHVLSDQIFKIMEHQGQAFSVVDSWWLAAHEGQTIYSYDMSGVPWFDMGTPERLAELEKYLLA